MKTPNKTLRMNAVSLCSEDSGQSLLELLVPENKGKFYTVKVVGSQTRFVVWLVNVGGDSIVPVSIPSGDLFGGPNPDFWKRCVVTDYLDSFINLTSRK